MSKVAGVVIESWKLPIFKRHLEAAGYVFTEHQRPGKDILTLRVKYEWVHELQKVVEAATAECKAVKK